MRPEPDFDLLTAACFVEGGFSGLIDFELDLGRTFSLEDRCWDVGRLLRSCEDFFLILNVNALGSYCIMMSWFRVSCFTTFCPRQIANDPPVAS